MSAAPHAPAIVCPACGAPADGPALTLRSSRGPGRWRRCRSCHSYFIDEPYDPTAEVAHQSAAYFGDAANAADLAAYKQKLFDAALDLIERHAPAPASILDVGCSFGGFLLRARARGHRVGGIDVNPAAVEHTSALGIPAALASRIEDATVLPSPLDAITCFDTSYYWTDQPRELNAAHARLRAGGVLLLRTSDRSLLVAMGRVLGPAGEGLVRLGLMDHRFAMPLRSLLRVIRSAGFDIVHASPRHAVLSHQGGAAGRLAFAVGAVAWERFGVSVGPGSLIVAKKPS